MQKEQIIKEGEVFDSIVKNLNFEDIKSRNDLISYIVRVYGDQWIYKPYKPILIYIWWIIIILGLVGLIYIGINGGLAKDQNLRISFHTLWITGSNIIYFLSALMLFMYTYTLARIHRYSIGRTFICMIYFLTPPLGPLYSIFLYFKKGILFEKNWFIGVAKVYASILFVPFTFWIGSWIGTLVSITLNF